MKWRSKPAPGVNSTVSSFHVKRQMQQARGCCYHERCSRIFHEGTKKFSGVISALGDPSCWFSQSNLSGYMPLTPANWSNRQKLLSLYAVVSYTGHLSYLILHHWFLLGLQPLCNMHQDQRLVRLKQAASMQVQALEQWVKFKCHGISHFTVNLFSCSVDIRSLWSVYVLMVQEKVSREAIYYKYSAT